MAKAKGRKYTKRERRAYYMGFGAGLKSNNAQHQLYGFDGAISSSFGNGYQAGKNSNRELLTKHVGVKIKKKKVSNPKPRTAPFTTDKKGRINGYNPKYPHKKPDMFIERKMMQNELFGDFDYDSKGRIKGSYIDGRFEPD